jgi:transcriptional regulator with XRE-family HTH domain
MVIVTQTVISENVRMATAPFDLIPKDLRREMRPEAVGYRLKLLRLAHGLKPAEIADMLDFERTYWSRFENGGRKLSDEVAVLLVTNFGVTLDFLMLGRWDKLPLDLSQKLREAERSLKNS